MQKELCNKCNYTLDTNRIDEDSVTINKKNDKIETYVYIELSTNNNIEITIGSDDFNFEKTVNSTDAVFKINSFIDNCKTPEELLKLATFIGNSLADGLPEYEIGNILEKLYSIYGLKEDTEKLIQSRISKLIEHKKQISRQEIIDASARSGDYKYIDKDTNDSEIITEAVKAGVWFEAITSSLSCGESAIYAYKSGCYKQYTYDTITKDDATSKMEGLMKAVAVGILTLLGIDILDIKPKDIKEIDNSYDGMIDKRYDINGHYMYFDGNKCMLKITYYGKDYEGIDKPEFRLGVEVYGEKTVVLNVMKAEFIDAQHIMYISDKFINRVKPHISIY